MAYMCAVICRQSSLRPNCFGYNRFSKSFFAAARECVYTVSRTDTMAFINTTGSDSRPYSGARAFTECHFKPSNDGIISSCFDKIKLSDELIHEFVWKNVDRWADKTALVCSVTGRSYSYAQLRKLSGKFAKSLRKNKLQCGDTIAVVLPNIPEFAIVVLGAVEAGLQVSSVNPGYTAAEMRFQLENSGASAVITVPGKCPFVQESIRNNANIKLPLIVVEDGTGDVPNGSIKLNDLISDNVEEFGKDEKTDRVNKDTAILPYSSGTTGLPKGVELSHRNIVANCMQLHCPEIFPAFETTSSHQDVVALILPMFHIYGLVVCLLNYLSVGTKLVCLPQFTPEGFLRCLKEFKTTILYAAPPMVLFLGNSDLVKTHHLDTVRFVMSGAAPIGAQSVARFLKRANHDIIMSQGYGLTETSPVVSKGKSGIGNMDSVGYLVPNTDIRIVGIDEDNLGQNLRVGLFGEIHVRGPQVMKGYLKNPEATANTMDGEWFKTGDLGYCNDEGMLFIKDRLKELIKVKGFQVAPAELEEILRCNEKILDAAVIAKPHERYGEIPKAFVVPKPGVKLEEDEVKDFVSKQVAKYKHLGSVQFLESIPKSLAGKILRRQLKDL